MCEVQISDADRLLINELKSKIQYELELVPSYSDDLSLLRWLVGWDRKVGELSRTALAARTTSILLQT